LCISVTVMPRPESDEGLLPVAAIISKSSAVTCWGSERNGTEWNETNDLVCIRFRARVSETVTAEQFESELVSEGGSNLGFRRILPSIDRDRKR